MRAKKIPVIPDFQLADFFLKWLVLSLAWNPHIISPSFSIFTADSLKLTCSDNEMSILVLRNQSSTTERELEVTLKDTTCKADFNSTYYMLIASYNTCGTIASSNNDSITYENIVLVKPKMADNAVILRKSDLSQTFEVKCIFDRNAQVRTETFNLTGRLNIRIKYLYY